MKLKPVVVLGPTCTGKSALGIELAKAYDGEIVSLDAFQVYKGLDIATAKVSDFQNVPHHLIDIVDMSYSMTVMHFQMLARETITNIQDRNKVPILVGGSALYIQAVLYDFEFHPTDLSIRKHFQAVAEDIGSEALHQRLADIDPQAAQMIAVGDTRRIIRALEVNEITGANYTAGLDKIEPYLQHTKVGLNVSGTVLRSRIESRVKEMFEHGLIAEVENLEAKGLFEAPTASRAIGYEDAWLVSQGLLHEDEAIKSIATKTMTYVKKQMKWFKRDSTIHWFDAESEALITDVKEYLRTTQSAEVI